MSQYLLKYSDNWADEMDLKGTVILDDEEYSEFKKAVKNVSGFTFCAGSNQ